MKRLLSIVVFCIAALSGCQWDPPRDNPLDPGSNAYHYPFGMLRVHALTLIQQPISMATVLLPELGRFLISDDSGLVEFDEVPTGTWWVVAYRDINGSAVYARDSARVTINVKQSSEVSLRLDALPRFTSAYAVSLVTSESETEDPHYFIRLKATVTDPDGPQHLERVESVFMDTLHNYSIHVDLQYNTNRDSAFWWTDIPPDSFRNSSTGNALYLPFTFRAFDFAEKASPPTTAFVARVLHGVPTFSDPQQDLFPNLEWSYTYYNELDDTTSFNYLVKIFRNTPELPEIYRRTVIPRNLASRSHTVEERLPLGRYLWEVWVLDNFGNSSRSRRGNLDVGPPP